MAELERRAEIVPRPILKGDRARLDLFPAATSLGQALGFVLLMLIYVVVLPILRGFQAVCNSVARRTTVWK